MSGTFGIFLNVNLVGNIVQIDNLGLIDNVDLVQIDCLGGSVLSLSPSKGLSRWFSKLLSDSFYMVSGIGRFQWYDFRQKSRQKEGGATIRSINSDKKKQLHPLWNPMLNGYNAYYELELSMRANPTYSPRSSSRCWIFDNVSDKVRIQMLNIRQFFWQGSDPAIEGARDKKLYLKLCSSHRSCSSNPLGDYNIHRTQQSIASSFRVFASDLAVEGARDQETPFNFRKIYSSPYSCSSNPLWDRHIHRTPAEHLFQLSCVCVRSRTRLFSLFVIATICSGYLMANQEVLEIFAGSPLCVL